MVSFSFCPTSTKGKKDREKLKHGNRVTNELTFLNMAMTSSSEDKAPYDNSISSEVTEEVAGRGREREMLKS